MRRADEVDVEQLCAQIDFIIAECSAILDAYRDFGPTLRRRDVDARVLRSFRWTDEALSVLVEESYLELLRMVQKTTGDEADPACASHLAAASGDIQLTTATVRIHAST